MANTVPQSNTARQTTVPQANFPEHFQQKYQSHLKHLKLKGLQPKTINAYLPKVRRAGCWPRFIKTGNIYQSLTVQPGADSDGRVERC